MKPPILIADDQRDVIEETAASPGAVIRAVGARQFDRVLIDLNYTRDTTSGIEGLELLEHLHRGDADAGQSRRRGGGGCDVKVADVSPSHLERT